MKYLLVFLIIITSYPSSGQEPWKLKKDKKGVKVYSRKSESSFNPVKVDVDLNCSIDQLQAILLDVDNYTEWVYSTKVSKLVKTISEDTLIYYSEIEVPWPASNRDFYSKAEINVSPSGDTLNLSTHVLPDFEKRKNGIVRIPKSNSKWTAIDQGTNLHLIYLLEADPGGNLPSWLVNLFFTKGPYSSFRNLKEKCAIE